MSGPGGCSARWPGGGYSRMPCQGLLDHHSAMAGRREGDEQGGSGLWHDDTACSISLRSEEVINL